ncbi:DUF4825 domain-containing protein [Brevibacillus sp. NRS-1366]|uniref:DUF4825 domain-containing protein n=1 Tax=Brevibacillus sp. NRS-1366 TaxID=3233899 RepID=UPI003D226F62
MITRHRAIILLAILGSALFALIQGVIIPGNMAKEEQYRQAQQNPITHDLDSILKYKSKYMGDASNLINLIQHLPLSQIQKSFQLDSKQLTIKVNYRETIDVIKESDLQRALLYNSLAAFALVDNLEAIEFHFYDASYLATRADSKEVFGSDLSLMLTKDQWKAMQEQLKDDQFVSKSALTMLQK